MVTDHYLEGHLFLVRTIPGQHRAAPSPSDPAQAGAVSAVPVCSPASAEQAP